MKLLTTLYVLLVILKLSNAIVGLTWILVHIPLMILAVIFILILINIARTGKRDDNVLREYAKEIRLKNNMK